MSEFIRYSLKFTFLEDFVRTVLYHSRHPDLPSTLSSCYCTVYSSATYAKSPPLSHKSNSAWCLTTLCLQKHLSVESVAMYVMLQTENCHRQSFSKVWKYNCYITELLGVTRSFLQRIKPSSWLHAVSDCEYKQESAKLPILCTVSLSGRGTRFVHQHCFPLN